MQGMLLPIILLIVLGVVVFALKTIQPGLFRKRVDYPYQKESTLFTAAERSFLGVLEQALQGQSRVFGKVRLIDVIKVKPGLNEMPDK